MVHTVTTSEGFVQRSSASFEMVTLQTYIALYRALERDLSRAER